jgi:hypothetical protein
METGSIRFQLANVGSLRDFEELVKPTVADFGIPIRVS